MTPGTRQMFAQFTIVAAGCAGAYAMVVMPAQERLSKAEHRLQELRSAGSTRATLPRDRADLLNREAQRRAQVIRARSSASRDEAALFTSITSLAARHGLRLDQLQPMPPDSTPPADPSVPAPKDVRSRCSVLAVGEFGRVVPFLADVQSSLGFVAIRSLELAPVGTPGSEDLRAFAVIELHGFDTAFDAAAGAMP